MLHTVHDEGEMFKLDLKVCKIVTRKYVLNEGFKIFNYTFLRVQPASLIIKPIPFYMSLVIFIFYLASHYYFSITVNFDCENENTFYRADKSVN